ncbi:MAG: VWA domain-containing protein, partial [Planctomycetaceae bacterium]|nr:VWA domain-containing protein [Planctomycetaceae bacterium]
THDPPETTSLDWSEILQPRGLTTRLGDSLDKLLVEAKSPTLSGIVIVSDGATNAGREVTFPRQRATDQGVRLVTVGVGSTEPPVNLELSRVIAPTDVQKGDAFEFSAILTGQGIAGRNVRVDLLQQGPSDLEPQVVYSEEQTLPDDGTPTDVKFDLKPAEAGTYEYTVRASLEGAVETREDDNQLSRSVSIYDRPLRVLVTAGAPMRDYQFARNALHRHPSMDIDIWLQSGEPGISQESRRLLFKFPETIEDLYEYDVLVMFDADWSTLDAEQRTRLSNWISNEGGGLITVAGDVFTPQLATDPELDDIRRLYPVLLDEVSLRLGSQDAATTPYPIGFTQEGQVAEFLKLEEGEDKSAFEEFEGVYRTYPTRGSKAGATIYAEFTDPLSRGVGGQPILLAGQRYGQGQVLYLGSPEMWRLRSVNASYLDRFWIKAVRKAAEGRSKRGLQRSMFILDGREFVLGQTIPLRLRALNPQYQPLVTDTLSLDAYGPGGTPILPGPELRRDPIRPAEYVGDFRPLTPGRYRLEFAVPDSAERISTELEVQLPRQEAASLIQEVDVLKQTVEGTGGTYLSLAEAAGAIPQLLPNKGEQIVIDQQIRELWDRQWLMFLLAGLLSLEWLVRKLLKLA